ERAGLVTALSGKQGSISFIGAVSPPGGDFSEPVTQSTLRIARVFWGLDAKLAYSRHFPSVNWLTSYSLYDVEEWWSKKDAEWAENRAKCMELLERESSLDEIVRLVGLDAIPDEDKLVMMIAGRIRDEFLKQNAYDKDDTYTSPEKQASMISEIIKCYGTFQAALASGKKFDELAALCLKDLEKDVKWGN
ncbi:MAG: V-type ATP synthase subunit A, partial [Candidatus Micrarchaeota archaeon]|nr:V-type ATP synthase subunit A [Candidatus Micrarchaeota archaeon]